MSATQASRPFGTQSRLTASPLTRSVQSASSRSAKPSSGSSQVNRSGSTLGWQVTVRSSTSTRRDSTGSRLPSDSAKEADAKLAQKTSMQDRSQPVNRESARRAEPARRFMNASTAPHTYRVPNRNPGQGMSNAATPSPVPPFCVCANGVFGRFGWFSQFRLRNAGGRVAPAKGKAVHSSSFSWRGCRRPWSRSRRSQSACRRCRWAGRRRRLWRGS